MRDCEGPAGGKCQFCGRPMPGQAVHRNCPTFAVVRVSGHQIKFPRLAVGDVVERLLLSVGISKELVARVTQNPDCGCELRKQWLNNAGYRAQANLENLLNAVVDFLFW